MELSNNSLLIRDKRPYILWRRVSTKKQGASGLGLEAQLEIAKIFTKREPKYVLTDVYSGTKLSECTNLWKAIERCKEEDLLLVIAKTDRFRNVREALEVLDAVGEGNLAFCDLPMVSRMVLTIMFAVWESQAMMGRINTQLALNARKKQLESKGFFISKAGNIVTKFGPRVPSVKNGSLAQAKARANQAKEWRVNSPGYNWVRRQLARGIPRATIVEEYNANIEMGIKGFELRKGGRFDQYKLSSWASEMGYARRINPIYQGTKMDLTIESKENENEEN